VLSIDLVSNPVTSFILIIIIWEILSKCA